MDKEQAEYLNNLINKRKNFNYCISSIFGDIRMDKIKYIKSYNINEFSFRDVNDEIVRKRTNEFEKDN